MKHHSLHSKFVALDINSDNPSNVARQLSQPL